MSEQVLPGGILDDSPDPLPIVPRKVGKTRYWVAGGLCLAAILALLVGGLSRNIVYYKTVAEAVESPPDGRFRIMGAVVAGSVAETDDGVRFRIRSERKEAEIIHHGDPPELFKEGAPVVCEGRFEGSVFTSDRIMIKHGSDYRPPPADAVSSKRDT